MSEGRLFFQNLKIFLPAIVANGHRRVVGKVKDECWADAVILLHYFKIFKFALFDKFLRPGMIVIIHAIILGKTA